jgi:hypothetical protein
MADRVKGPAPAETSLVTRPPPGPARGSIPAPVWLVVGLSVALLLVCLLLLWRGLRRRRL